MIFAIIITFKRDRFYLPGFTFLVPAHPGSRGQNPEEPGLHG